MVFCRVATADTGRQFRKAQSRLRSNHSENTCEFARNRWRSWQRTRSKCSVKTAARRPSSLHPMCPEDAISVEYILWLRSEEHTSELQSQSNLVCRLLLE